MTDKERVEEIDVVHYEEDEDGNHFVLLKEDDYWFLKEQAERAQELESENRALKAVAKSNKTIGEHCLHQSERYREALEFYADVRNYLPQSVLNARSNVSNDCGERARKELRDSK